MTSSSNLREGIPILSKHEPLKRSLFIPLRVPESPQYHLQCYCDPITISIVWPFALNGLPLWSRWHFYLQQLLSFLSYIDCKFAFRKFPQNSPNPAWWPLRMTTVPNALSFRCLKIITLISQRFFLFRLYYFLKATLTNYQKLGGLKDQKFILSQFRKPDVWNQGLSSSAPSLKPLGESIFCFFQLLVVTQTFLGLWLYNFYLCFHFPKATFSACISYKDIYFWI